jgi:hypothetical protein
VSVSHAERTTPIGPNGPNTAQFDPAALAEAVEACFDCAQACATCADACLDDRDGKTLIRCIRLNLDCVDVCAATGSVLSRKTALDVPLARLLLQACAHACKVCADECEQHAQRGIEPCRVGAAACRRCEAACDRLLSSVAA